jgi:hypothetical protein
MEQRPFRGSCSRSADQKVPPCVESEGLVAFSQEHFAKLFLELVQRNTRLGFTLRQYAEVVPWTVY